MSHARYEIPSEANRIQGIPVLQGREDVKEQLIDPNAAVSAAPAQPLRWTVHSNDFTLFPCEKINGKARDEWETEHQVEPYIESLRKYGWTGFYQWRWVSPEKIAETAPGLRTCFAEVFSEYYNGYLRGDGLTLAEAFGQCLARAERFAACEVKEGHTFRIPWENGYFDCAKCGFGGYSPVYRGLSNQIDHYKLYVEMAQKENANLHAILKRHGIKINIIGQEIGVDDQEEE